MIVLTNGLTSNADEGAVKIASSLIRRIKASVSETFVITYERQALESDIHLTLNKFFLNSELIRLIRERQEPVLYVPFPAPILSVMVRVFLLCVLTRRPIKTLLVMNGTMNLAARCILKFSGSEVLTVSRESLETFQKVIGQRAKYLKTGVDTAKFVPVEGDVKASLREKYGIPQKKKVVLHVGHMKAGRNIGRLLSLGEDWHIVLAVSTLTTTERDVQLREAFLAKSNVTLIEDYVPDIQELYQLADVYLFPVLLKDHCIDVPLSALEAAACGIPVVTTAFGELKELLKKPGFYPIESLEPAALDALLKQAAEEAVSPRETVLEYDWENTVKDLLN